MTGIFKSIMNNLSNPNHGWKTTHFWGPVANWGLVAAAVYDASFKGVDTINVRMTATLAGYSCLFVRFAWMVQPRNYLLFTCHAFNVMAQLNQLRRVINYKLNQTPNGKQEIVEYAQKAGITLVGLASLILMSGKIKTSIANSAFPQGFKNIVTHAAGPLTIFFWAPTSKWLLSVNNIIDLNKPTDKMSLSQQLALTSTGLIWTRYSFVITPINYNLAIVNLVLGITSGYHLLRKIRADYNI